MLKRALAAHRRCQARRNWPPVAKEARAAIVGGKAIFPSLSSPPPPPRPLPRSAVCLSSASFRLVLCRNTSASWLSARCVLAIWLTARRAGVQVQLSRLIGVDRITAQHNVNVNCVSLEVPNRPLHARAAATGDAHATGDAGDRDAADTHVRSGTIATADTRASRIRPRGPHGEGSSGLWRGSNR